MTDAGPARQPRSLDAFRKERRLGQILPGYDNLVPAYERARAAIAGLGNERDGELWLAALLQLAEANLSGRVIASFLRLSEGWGEKQPVALLALLGEAAARVGRLAGTTAAAAVLLRLPQALGHLKERADLATMLDTLERLAETAPDTLPLVTARLGTLLASLDALGVQDWASGGLRAYAHDPARRRAYFALEDPLSRRLLGRAGDGDLSRLERRLGAGLKSIWDIQAPLRAMRVEDGQTAEAPAAPRRASFAGGIVRLPESFPNVTGAAADSLYRAAVAHIGAHLRHSTIRFPIGSLKPLQVALVSLIEDARVEALAMAEMHGLARLWSPFHRALPSDGATIPGLFMRLARALHDPDVRDEHGWIEKGRALFVAARSQLGDPTISRRIGSLLGNDLGQMRLQFNAREHVVEPIYRDDNMGLWDFGDQADAVMDQLAIAVDAARVERRERPDGRPEEGEQRGRDTGRARESASAGDDGIAVATYPEWDHALARAREGWTTILECEATPTERHDPAASTPIDIERRVTALARGAAIGRRMRERGLQDGDALDLDACIAAAISRRAGLSPDPRVFVREVPGPRDLAMVLLIDLSQSTADVDAEGRSVLATETATAAILAHAVDAAGDALAIHGFRSDGREKVRYYPIKAFGEAFDALTHRRLAGLRSGQSTRLGAALRHAGTSLARRRAFRRVLLVLTDGEPSDVDVPDPVYLVEDARRAVHELRQNGIDVFAFGIGVGSFRNLGRIVGARRALSVPRLGALPARVMQLYAELKK